MKYTLSLLLLLLAFSSIPARAQVMFNQDERRIITITDERRDADSLLPYLSSVNTRTAWRAAIGIGNIGDTTVRAALLQSFLAEHRDSVAEAEAFALGLLGPDQQTAQALISSVNKHPSSAVLVAIARCMPSQDSPSGSNVTAVFLHDLVWSLLRNRVVDSLGVAKAYVEFALHKHISWDPSTHMAEDVEALASNDDSRVRWRAAYVFARAGDSLDLASRFARLKALLLDQGSPTVRMFAASALGKLHNAQADTALAETYRGEEDWRVRVNIIRAFSQFPALDSIMLGTLQLAVTDAYRDSTLATQIGLTAADAVDHFVNSGTLTPADSITLRAWLDGFNGTDGRNEQVAQVVCAKLTIPAARLHTPTLYTAIQNYAQFNIPYIRNFAVQASALLPDTTYFSPLLISMSMVSPQNQAAQLEALDSEWQHAKQLPTFRAQLEANRSADLFRGLVIHISDADPDAAVVSVAMSVMQDTSIINDSARRAEAVEYVTKYISEFTQRQSSVQLLAAVEADNWLGDRSPAAERALRIAYDSANVWSDNVLLDTLAYSIRRIDGPKAALPARISRVSHIDWNTLEHIPSKMIINFEENSIELHLLTAEAPLTVLNMVRLARQQFFAGNTIHRIVPNFVIQSGDPTGTGYGGPSYMIRSEITPREYDREGLAGMASDGKDTEGSQWFITECPTPHLDTHYTIWAEVTGDMPQVYQRSVGDRVDSINAY
ncbi:MAG TPA: peptidylprolyl isomerase [Candidatus Kapabacteria bacterium]|nr:peptidylprolyl isomerase [Candidatus Kapabacteria bacterium]